MASIKLLFPEQQWQCMNVYTCTCTMYMNLVWVEFTCTYNTYIHVPTCTYLHRWDFPYTSCCVGSQFLDTKCGYFRYLYNKAKECTHCTSPTQSTILPCMMNSVHGIFMCSAHVHVYIQHTCACIKCAYTERELGIRPTCIYYNTVPVHSQRRIHKFEFVYRL